jgi:aspartate aminotransferase-like enzyme
MAAADMHHRTAEFRALFQKVLAQLKVFVGTKNDVLLLACSGTGAMEASVSNLTSPGDKVLVLTAGKFGERWTGLAKAFGCEPDVLTAPYGQTFDLAAVRAALKPEHKVIYTQATETSTAVRHDVEAIAKLRDQVAPNTLLVVDGITGLGTTHFDVDGWGIDVLIGGSQKAVMIPPGLAYLSVSDRAWAAMETTKNPRYYFDLRKERKNAVKGESAYTPAVALVAALGAALDYIAGQAGGDLEKGRIALIDNAQVNAAATRAGLVALGFTLFAPTSPAPQPRPSRCLKAWTRAWWSRRSRQSLRWSRPTARARCRAKSFASRTSASSTISTPSRCSAQWSTSPRTISAARQVRPGRRRGAGSVRESGEGIAELALLAALRAC